ncbi:ABC transporter substrate-binding protein [Candidatus Epulonipiscium viviparus]|uniref:ABC transporter substrate-binding protein n=1 Tax=Candidatus Epulonipiscium viviparus TaxID=420336 RepID=UPI00016C0A1D|nr:sugar ABC transporter substrate-binding protein [Candidatus Epulopiscium viviparus]
MKKFWRLILSGIMMASLAGCSADSESGDVVELEFMQWWSTEDGGDSVTSLISEFEAAHPDIKIKLVTLPFGEVRTQAIASRVSKSLPDVIAMNPPWAREFYDLNMIAPLDDLMAADPTFDKSAFMPTSLTPIDGHTYLLPVTTSAFYLYYNDTMFANAGLELPKTWADITSAAKALTDPSKNEYGFTLTLAEQEASNGSILSIYPLLYALNGRTFVDGKFTVETPEMYQVFSLLQQLLDDGSLLPGTTSRSEFQNMELFSVGNVGMMISPDLHMMTITDRNPDLDFGLMPLPTFDGTGQPELRHHGWDIAISSTSEHKEEAWKFISFLTSKENNEKLCDALLKMPSRYDSEITWTDQFPQDLITLDSLNNLNMVEELMLMPNSSACWVALTKAGAAVIQGSMSVEEALASVQTTWNATLNQ